MKGSDKRPSGTPITKQFLLNRCVINDHTGCWEWQFGKSTDGYGQLKDEKDRMCRAHRVAWQLWKGEIPAGLSVLHHCDNPACCNPEHLFLGTQDDNMKDCAKKGRIVTRPGPLSREKVIRIRGAEGKMAAIARAEGVSKTVVRGIKKMGRYSYFK